MKISVDRGLNGDIGVVTISVHLFDGGSQLTHLSVERAIDLANKILELCGEGKK